MEEVRGHTRRDIVIANPLDYDCANRKIFILRIALPLPKIPDFGDPVMPSAVALIVGVGVLDDPLIIFKYPSASLHSAPPFRQGRQTFWHVAPLFSGENSKPFVLRTFTLTR